MDGGGAKEGADFDDGFGLDFLDEVLENGAFWAPAFDAAASEEGGGVGRGEVDEGGGGVEEAVKDGLADEVRREWGGAVGGESEVVELSWEVDELGELGGGRRKRGGCWRRRGREVSKSEGEEEEEEVGDGFE